MPEAKKISEVIAELNELLAEYGDISVLARDYFGDDRTIECDLSYDEKYLFLF